jgi:hypothetical protein
MSFLLFVLGAVMAAAGIMMIGFGIPINEFSLGNTLIISGTTAVAGGFIVIGLAVVARQLKVLGETEPVAARGPRSSDQGEPRGGPPRPQGAPPRGRSDAPRDPRFSASQDDDEPLMEVPTPAPTRVPPSQAFEPREDAPPPRGPRIPGIAAPRAPEPALRRESPSPRQSDSFESAWPDASRSEQPPFGPTPRVNGEAGGRPPKATERGPATILKSGVVDGMAYTLYTDGSIEAELAQGVVRFGSIEELRNHLEKNN